MCLGRQKFLIVVWNSAFLEFGCKINELCASQSNRAGLPLITIMWSASNRFSCGNTSVAAVALCHILICYISSPYSDLLSSFLSLSTFALLTEPTPVQSLQYTLHRWFSPRNGSCNSFTSEPTSKTNTNSKLYNGHHSSYNC